jgi:hypothetical protein
MMGISVAERYERIKKWLYEYDKFVVNEREDNNFHFSFYIWDKGGKTAIIPIIIAYLKECQKNGQRILIGWGWELDLKSDLVRDVLNDSDKKSRFVSSLKNVIDPDIYILNFIPDERELKSIKLSRIYPIDRLNKVILFNEIIQVMLQYGNVILHLELKSGRPTSINKFRR